MAKEILLIEGNNEKRNRIKSIIINSNSTYNVHFATDFYDAITLLQKFNIDILIFSVSLFVTTEPELISILKKSPSSIKLIALFQKNTEQHIKHIYELGAKCFLQDKNIENQLINALRVVQSKNNLIDSDLLYELVKQVEYKLTVNDENIGNYNLDKFDIELLGYIKDEFTNKAIAERLNLSQKSIELKIHALAKKLNVKSKIGLAVYAEKLGLTVFITELIMLQ